MGWLQWILAQSSDQKVVGGLICSNLIGLIFLIATGLVKNYQDIALHRRKIWTEKQIAFLETQLSVLYGPIYALLKTNESLWLLLRQNRHVRDYQTTIVRDAIIPNNAKIVTTLQNSFHLMEPSSLPHALSFMAHVEWQNASGVASGTVPSGVLPFPTEFAEDVYAHTEEMKRKLIQKRQRYS